MKANEIYRKGDLHGGGKRNSEKCLILQHQYKTPRDSMA
jgi:hypothetical protein